MDNSPKAPAEILVSAPVFEEAGDLRVRMWDRMTKHGYGSLFHEVTILVRRPRFGPVSGFIFNNLLNIVLFEKHGLRELRFSSFTRKGFHFYNGFHRR